MKNEIIEITLISTIYFSFTCEQENEKSQARMINTLGSLLVERLGMRESNLVLP